MPCRIEISEVELSLQIGCSEQERATPQPIGLGLLVRSLETFPACHTDRLHDTLDAAEMKKALIEAASNARVHTLERLGGVVELSFKEKFRAHRCDWEVTIRKPRFGWSYVHAWSS